MASLFSGSYDGNSSMLIENLVSIGSKKWMCFVITYMNKNYIFVLAAISIVIVIIGVVVLYQSSSNTLADQKRASDLKYTLSDCWFINSRLMSFVKEYGYTDLTEDETYAINSFVEECKRK